MWVGGGLEQIGREELPATAWIWVSCEFYNVGFRGECREKSSQGSLQMEPLLFYLTTLCLWGWILYSLHRGFQFCQLRTMLGPFWKIVAVRIKWESVALWVFFRDWPGVNTEAAGRWGQIHICKTWAFGRGTWIFFLPLNRDTVCLCCLPFSQGHCLGKLTPTASVLTYPPWRHCCRLSHTAKWKSKPTTKPNSGKNVSRTFSSQSHPRVRPGEHTHWLFHLGEQFGTLEWSKLITHNFPPKYISYIKSLCLRQNTCVTASFVVLQDGKISESISPDYL